MPAIDHFVGHDEDLNKLWNQLQPETLAIRKVVVLHGLGGIGKTQLAIRFARLHQHDFSPIFWLNGKNQETLMRFLAAFLPKIPDVNMAAGPKIKEEIEQQARQVLQWLATARNSKWLLIFDNIDKYSATEDLDGETYDVTKFFPTADHGSIIITTRVPQLAEVGRPYPVQKLHSDEAVELLVNSTGLDAESTKTSSLYSGQSRNGPSM